MAPVIWELQRANDIECIVIDTGQHREMLEPLLKYFHILPTISLRIMTRSQSLANLSAALMKALDRALGQLLPHVLLVQGDTTSAFVAALVAFYHQIPVGHVEAGLRTYHLYSPFPEEANRHMLAVVTSFYFSPTDVSTKALRYEGVPPEMIVQTGNTVIDTIKWMLQQPVPNHTLLSKLNALRGAVVLVTSHRRESQGQVMRSVFLEIRRLCNKHMGVIFVFPVHLNPVVQALSQEVFRGVANMLLEAPIGYDVFIHVLRRCHMVLTDSGGIQEEASFLGIPVLVLRNNTERPEGVLAGVSQLVQVEELFTVADHLLQSPAAHRQMARRVTVYGDGHAAERIVRHLADHRPALVGRHLLRTAEVGGLPQLRRLGIRVPQAARPRGAAIVAPRGPEDVGVDIGH